MSEGSLKEKELVHKEANDLEQRDKTSSQYNSHGPEEKLPSIVNGKEKS